MRIAINGFGRIGRSFLRTIMQDEKSRKLIDVAVVNIGPARIDNIGYMFKYDTIMGTYPGRVEFKDSYLIVDDKKIKIVSECEPQDIGWKKNDIEWVVDCSGCFTHRKDAQKHLDAGAQCVLISAPSHDEDVCVVPGVNDFAFNKDNHKIVSLGSCTTNAFLPILHVLHQEFGIEKGVMTTIHAYTNTQVLLDVENSGDVRRSRAAALNIIPTTTGAARLVGKIIPELEGLVKAVAIRVPVGDVSLIDFTFNARVPITTEKINNAFIAASKKHPNIIAHTNEPLVSSDYIGSRYSVTIDGLMTGAHEGVGKVFGWYDNEWGYSCRLRDFLLSTL
ncbi:type I glyceraldehyde-3-phosphate dehydrogenase [Candidatus Dependentiae bacterium]|nr:type I glyceraldehyde-3-phosphate dehydrogenase [Candidatus Dependentiae bacterium]